MDLENADPEVEAGGNGLKEDMSDTAEKAHESESIKSASYWNEIDKEELERERM